MLVLKLPGYLPMYLDAQLRVDGVDVAESDQVGVDV